MDPYDYFKSMTFLEPHCPCCNIRLDYGITTTFDEAAATHRCKGCGQLV